ncbi:MAG: Fur family transcriptional regulator, partial [Steroidobacteraceae bacterium]
MELQARSAVPGPGRCERRLSGCGIRPTTQRVRIATLLLSAPQHLSAEQILANLRSAGARVSKATVYNTLNLFASRGLIR